MHGFHLSIGSVIKIGLASGAAAALYVQPYRVMMFVGGSMEPTYKSHSLLLTAPVQANELCRGMVVIINMEGGPIVKRIAYLPGDKILQAKFGAAWCDLIYVKPTNKAGLDKLTTRYFTVPKDELYVLGDNQAVSCDSRQFGCVSTSCIECQVIDERPFRRFTNVPQTYLAHAPVLPQGTTVVSQM